MRAARLATLVALLLLAPLVATAPAMETGPPAGPKGLRGFLLRPNESVSRTFPRTPSFAWSPVRGASCYEFQLATSRTFEESTIVWSNVPTDAKAGKFCVKVKRLSTRSEADPSGEIAEVERTVVDVIPPIRIPALSLNLTLPWFTGRPYALHSRVRAITARGATGWSRPFGFNVRWEHLPVPMASRPGLVRWQPVEGATAYEVWYPDIRKSFRTHTNVADQREFYIFHLENGWWSTVRWRVRAVRQVRGSIPNGLPAVSYGPWSPTYATTNPDWSAGKLLLRATVSDVVSSNWKDGAHELMPAFTFGGDRGLDDREYRLFRAYASTDRDCVNVVFRSSVVGGPAFAPRTSGPLKLPASQDELDYALAGVLPSALEETAATVSADGRPVTSSESVADLTATPRVDLPDVDAKTTRYYWTIVPVGIEVSDNGAFVYVDTEVPQDACEAGRVSTFAKLSRPTIAASGGPYVSGLTPKGRLLTSTGQNPLVYSTPLVAWRPAVGATAYEIVWSRTNYPWRTRSRIITQSTSAILNLKPGRWYYRVRGLNSAQVGVSAMTWSKPVTLRVARPTFRISG
jgi:hypothetical protein